MRAVNESGRSGGTDPALQKQGLDFPGMDTSLARANGRGLAGSCHGIAARKHPQGVASEASLKRAAKSRRHIPLVERLISFLDGARPKYWVALGLTLASTWAVTL